MYNLRKRKSPCDKHEGSLALCTNELVYNANARGLPPEIWVEIWRLLPSTASIRATCRWMRDNASVEAATIDLWRGGCDDIGRWKMFCASAIAPRVRHLHISLTAGEDFRIDLAPFRELVHLKLGAYNTWANYQCVAIPDKSWPTTLKVLELNSVELGTRDSPTSDVTLRQVPVALTKLCLHKDISVGGYHVPLLATAASLTSLEVWSHDLTVFDVIHANISRLPPDRQINWRMVHVTISCKFVRRDLHAMQNLAFRNQDGEAVKVASLTLPRASFGAAHAARHLSDTIYIKEILGHPVSPCVLFPAEDDGPVWRQSQLLANTQQKHSSVTIHARRMSLSWGSGGFNTNEIRWLRSSLTEVRPLRAFGHQITLRKITITSVHCCGNGVPVDALKFVIESWTPKCVDVDFIRMQCENDRQTLRDLLQYCQHANIKIDVRDIIVNPSVFLDFTSTRTSIGACDAIAE